MASRTIKETSNYVWIEAAAGESWHQLVKYCVAQGYGGIENLALIPGTVGAAPIQNIGAYGVELKETLIKLQAIDLRNGKAITLSNAECQFSYRSSCFKSSAYQNKFLITAITLRLHKNPKLVTNYPDLINWLATQQISAPSLRDVFTAVVAIRQNKLPDPTYLPNAGSFFKNPIISQKLYQQLQKIHPKMPHYLTEKGIKIPAAWLIEECGWKGKQQGGVSVAKTHALILVNQEHRPAKELLALAKKIQSSVKRHFQIKLEPEVTIVSETTN